MTAPSRGAVFTADRGTDLTYTDGFGDPSDLKQRLLRGTLLSWSDAQHWTDRDGLPAPSPLLVIGVTAALQKWRGGKPEVILDKPLPDVDDLNGAIPIEEWELGVDGQKRKPWAHVVVVYAIDPAAGGFFTYVSATTGAHIAFDHLKDAVTSMRMLRGAKVLPLVKLAERPMKTKFGVKTRPHFEIIGWKEAAGATFSEEPAQAALPAAGDRAPQSPKVKRDAAAETLVRMGDVKLVTTAETVEDDIPY